MKLDEALWRAFDGSVRAAPLSKHLGSEHDQKTHGRRQGSLAGKPFSTNLDVILYEPNIPETLYHAAPKKARADILANGLDPKDQTHNTGAGPGVTYRDEHLWETGDDGEEFAFEYRPIGVYFFQTLEDAKRYAGDRLDIYQVDTGKVSGEIIRDPVSAMNWDYLDDRDRTYVARYVEPEALELIQESVAKHLGNEHDQMTHGRRKTSGRARWERDELRGASRKQDSTSTEGVANRFLQNAEAAGVDHSAGFANLKEVLGFGGIYGLLYELGADWNTGPDMPLPATFSSAVDEMVKEIGLDVGNTRKDRYDSMWDELNDEGKETLKMVARAYYEQTQSQLTVDSMRLWRGISMSSFSDANRPTSSIPLSQVTVVESVISSWTTSYNVARSFAQRGQTQDASAILHDVVPREYIFSVGGGTAMGTESEAEVVVLGRPHEVDLLSRLYSERDVDAVLTGERSPFREGEVEKAKVVIDIDEDEENRNWLRQSD